MREETAIRASGDGDHASKAATARLSLLSTGRKITCS